MKVLEIFDGKSAFEKVGIIMKNPYGLSDEEMENIDKIVEQRMEEWGRKRIPTVYIGSNGNTYIRVEEYDHVSFASMTKIWNLLSMMGLEEEIWCEPNDGFSYVVKGDNYKRAAYIQSFIDNGYKLTWE